MSSEGVTGDISGLLRGLNTSTQQLRQSVDAERDARVQEHELLQQQITTARKAVWRSSAAFAIVILVLVGFIVNRQIQERNDKQDALRAAIVTCENANRFRSDTDERFNSFLDVLAGASSSATTAEAAKAREAVVATIKTNFASTRPPSWEPRDCSPEGVRAPTPLPTTTTTVVVE